MAILIWNFTGNRSTYKYAIMCTAIEETTTIIIIYNRKPSILFSDRLLTSTLELHRI